MKNPKIRTTIALILALYLTLTLASCSTSSQNDVSEEDLRRAYEENLDEIARTNEWSPSEDSYSNNTDNRYFLQSDYVTFRILKEDQVGYMHHQYLVVEEHTGVLYLFDKFNSRSFATTPLPKPDGTYLTLADFEQNQTTP